MKDFFPSWQKSVGTVSLFVIGMITWIAIDKYFNVESKLPSKPMSNGGASNGGMKAVG